MKLRNPQVLRELTRPRTNRHITIPQLAQKSGVTEGMIYHLLKGRHEVTLPVAERIAEAAGVEASVLFVEERPNG